MKIDIIGWLGELYSHFPSFSQESKAVLVKILPSFVLVLGILMTVASVLEILGTPILSVFTLGKSSLIQMLVLPNILGIAQGVLMTSSFKALRDKKIRGWRVLFWSQLLWVLAGLISLNPSLILGFIAFYLLFQVKSYYK